MRILLGICLLLMLFGCNTDKVIYAPVSDAITNEPIPKKGFYEIKQGETLYSVAWRYGLDYRYVAKRNQISAPYAVYPGEKIYLRGAPPPAAIKPVVTPVKVITKPLQPVVIEREPTAPVRAWTWPAKGPLLSKFSGLNKGINIGGKEGDPIFATAAGKVVYSGDGLRGYGNLIILKHNSLFLSAYAHNSKILVKEGQWVKAGQKIAQMGDSGARRIMLYFEIRKEGKPLNPLSYLGK